MEIAALGSGPHSLRWVTPPRTVLVVAKPDDAGTLDAARQLTALCQSRYPSLRLVYEPSLARALSISRSAPPLSDIDLVVGFGGDGTLLHVSSTFASGSCPPVLGFSLGTIGFMMPFNIDALETALEDTLTSRGNVILRMRLSCSVVGKGEGALAVGTDHQALNEVHIHRGRHPHLTRIDTIVNGRRLTEAVGDGLLVSTPTGSTAYSLSAGGPIVHPSVPGMLLTPICPRSLAFRSVVLPSDAQIELRVQPSSRSSVEVSLDGREGTPLEPGQALRVGMSEYPVPSLVPAGEDTFLADLDLLAWNATFTRRRPK